MKLLIVTQSVDRNNPILGFFHRWIEEFAKTAESVTVICLEKGEFSLPPNTKVLSLGKEVGQSRLKYIFNFFRYIWSERREYDVVFVHMNQEYIIMGSFIWKLLGKKISMWRNHYFGCIKTQLACLFCDKIFCTSRYSYVAKFSKAKIMPVGIDHKIFSNLRYCRDKNTILFLGRITPAKKPHLLIQALKMVMDEGYGFRALFIGKVYNEDVGYFNSLEKMVLDLGLTKHVSFGGEVSNLDAVNVYNSNNIFVNLSGSGMYDKTIFESILCGMIPLVLSKDFGREFGEFFVFGDLADLSRKIISIIAMREGDLDDMKTKLRTGVLKRHTLTMLISLLNNELK